MRKKVTVQSILQKQIILRENMFPFITDYEYTFLNEQDFLTDLEKEFKGY